MYYYEWEAMTFPLRSLTCPVTMLKACQLFKASFHKLFPVYSFWSFPPEQKHANICFLKK